MEQSSLCLKFFRLKSGIPPPWQSWRRPVSLATVHSGHGGLPSCLSSLENVWSGSTWQLHLLSISEYSAFRKASVECLSSNYFTCPPVACLLEQPHLHPWQPRISLIFNLVILVVEKNNKTAYSRNLFSRPLLLVLFHNDVFLVHAPTWLQVGSSEFQCWSFSI